MLILEGAQAGLSWLTILKRREGYRQAFDNFDVKKIARYDARKTAALLKNPGIIRNRLKIAAAVANAGAFLQVQREFGTFDAFIWSFPPKTKKQRKRGEKIPPKTREAEAMSKDLRKRGFRFVGPTICYAFMQAVGMVNDHAPDCFRASQV
jgi:DNA-3-methyladenine glycosylase I